MPFFCRVVASFFYLVMASVFASPGFAQEFNPDTGSVRDLIGYTALAAELGSAMPDGAGSSIAIVEAGSSNYLPNPASFPGKTINDRGFPPEGETAGVSGHATGSAIRFFGTVGSSPATDNIDAYSAGFWLGGGGLNFGSNRPPLAQAYNVSNHSYILRANNAFGTTEAEDLLTRLDFYIDQNDSLVVAGSSNGESTTLPLGLAASVNVLAVGRTDGSHGAAETTFYLPGRTKVDIVSPSIATDSTSFSSTSGATPIAASVGSFLVDAAAGDADAIEVETLKATLMAGATKEEFPQWDRTATRPIDERFGAGEVNVYHSYMIQAGGQYEGTSTLGGSVVGDHGWDYRDSYGSERFYRFEVSGGQYLNELSIVLSWNVDIVDDTSGFNRFSFTPIVNLINLDLELFDDQGNLVDASLSTVDNVEHIYIKDLAPGIYDLKVSGDADSDFAIAWRLNGSALPGDFNLDQVVDVTDIDHYSGNLGLDAEGELAQLDLDGDGQITQADHDLHVTTLAQTSGGGFGTVIGDLNLDGQTGVLGDAFVLISNLGSTEPVWYADGDLNADGIVDVLNDAFRLLGNLGAQVLAVPSS
jgi:hypothetical protein